jgi:hypothetical protein
MNTQILTTVFSVIIAAIVSFIVVFLTRRSETIKHFESIRTDAYVDFIRGVAGLAIMQRSPVQEGKEQFLKGMEAKVLVADAKARIAIYGSEPVVSLLAKFLRGGAILDSPERAREFTTLCQKMRSDGCPRPQEVTDEDIHFLLFGLEMKDFL